MNPERWRLVSEVLGAVLDLRCDDRANFLDRACAHDPELREQVDALLAADRDAGELLEAPAFDPNAWRREELFRQAAGLPPGERAAFLDRVSEADAELRCELESLLASDMPENALLHAAFPRAFQGFPTETGESPEPIGTRIGRYRITGLIGKGGMGAVYLAAREDDFRMQVAIKLLKRGTDTETALRRFRVERQILAGLQHPNIARLLDGGDTETGLPYLVMEHVDGIPLLEYAAPLPVRARLELFRSLCSAVHYAHQRQIVHRDIKPANILVTGEGIPRLLDFGIAKLLDPAPHTAGVTLTGGGVRPMTPEYASPEQVRGEAVTAATDIYSLGAVLYELLTGRKAQQVEACGPGGIAEVICTREPRKPSAVVPELDPDLDNIVMMALRKEPERRYPSAEELSADIDRYLHDQPVHARPESVLYRGRKFLKRNRAPATAAVASAIVVLSLLAGLERFASDGYGNARSLAVLPLENLSGDPDQEYFAEGVTDALISNLAQLQGVRVISRTSSMTFKGVRRKLPEVARSLKVRMIAEGSVLRSGGRISLAVRLVDAQKDTPVWSGRYEGDASEVVGLQEKAAAAIAKEIGASLSARHKARALRYQRVDLGAYDAYLRGRHQYFADFSRESVEKAIALYQKALGLDPRYAPAYSGLADCYYMLSNTHYPPTEMMPKAKWAAEQAIRLDDTLGEAHGTLALVRSLYEFRRREAGEGFRRAIGLKPSDALVRLWYAFHLAGMGQFNQSLAEVEQAAQLDPVSPGMNAYGAWPLFFARRYDEVIQRLQPLADAHPDYNLAYALLGEAHAYKGEWSKAIPYLEKAHQMDGLPESLAQLGRGYAAAGRTADAREVLQRLRALSQRRFASAYLFALVHTGLGERDEAFRWLQKAEEDRSEWFALVNVDPRLDLLRSDPRFAGVLRAVGLR
jgi:serine/threonine-protein kinase